jgi:hypothetical protein
MVLQNMCQYSKGKNISNMKKLLFIFTGILFTMSGFAQQETELDTIYRLGGRKLTVDVRKVTSTMVTYVDQEDNTENLERKEIQRIVYHTGKIEVFNKPVFQLIDDYSWEAVVLTEKPNEVDGLYERGKVSAKSSPSKRSAKAAKRSCTIRLQKKAANMKGIIILVTHKEALGGYGELPGYYMEGVVYGFEPLEEAEQSDNDGQALRGGVAF